MITRDDFAHQLLLEFDLPLTTANKTALLAWMAAENTTASYNPLATTHKCPRSKTMPGNRDGVQIYHTLQDGIHMTVATLGTPYYDAIRAALKRGTDAVAVAKAIEASPWGTKGVEAVLPEVEKALSLYALKAIPL